MRTDPLQFLCPCLCSVPASAKPKIYIMHFVNNISITFSDLHHTLNGNEHWLWRLFRRGHYPLLLVLAPSVHCAAVLKWFENACVPPTGLKVDTAGQSWTDEALCFGLWLWSVLHFPEFAHRVIFQSPTVQYSLFSHKRIPPIHFTNNWKQQLANAEIAEQSDGQS